MDSEKRKPDSEIDTVLEKLTGDAMLSLAPDERLKRDFWNLKQRLDQVVRSEEADRAYPEGAIHAGLHRVRMPGDAACGRNTSENAPDALKLLEQAAEMTMGCVKVPRIM